MMSIRKSFSIMLVALVAIALTGIGAGTVLAEEEAGEEGRNELSLFLGGTHTSDDDGFSVGLDYEYHVNRRFGIGGLLEYTGPDFREWIVGLPICWHPWRELKLFVAPGVDFDRPDDKTYFLVRIGSEYGFGIGRGFEIAPALNIDFTSEETSLVYGVSIAKKF
jgi:hypothetical protein